MIGLSAHVYSNQLVLGGTLFGFASSYQVRPRASNGIFDHICEKGCQHDTNQQAQDCDMSLVEGRLEYDRPKNDQGQW